jgi:hypothetical protein
LLLRSERESRQSFDTARADLRWEKRPFSDSSTSVGMTKGAGGMSPLEPDIVSALQRNVVSVLQ